MLLFVLFYLLILLVLLVLVVVLRGFGCWLWCCWDWCCFWLFDCFLCFVLVLVELMLKRDSTTPPPFSSLAACLHLHSLICVTMFELEHVLILRTLTSWSAFHRQPLVFKDKPTNPAFADRSEGARRVRLVASSTSATCVKSVSYDKQPINDETRDDETNDDSETATEWLQNHDEARTKRRNDETVKTTRKTHAAESPQTATKASA